MGRLFVFFNNCRILCSFIANWAFTKTNLLYEKIHFENTTYFMFV